MSKEDAVNHLTGLGYDAILKDGIVYVYGAEHKDVGSILKENGYKQSYGSTTKRRTGEST